MSSLTPHFGGGVILVSVWTPPLTVLGKNSVSSSTDSKMFKLKVKASQSCSECSQCLSGVCGFLDRTVLHSTVTQECRNIKGWIESMALSENEYRWKETISAPPTTHPATHTHTYTHTRAQTSIYTHLSFSLLPVVLDSAVPLQATILYMKMTFGCICQHSICSHNTIKAPWGSLLGLSLSNLFNRSLQYKVHLVVLISTFQYCELGCSVPTN